MCDTCRRYCAVVGWAVGLAESGFGVCGRSTNGVLSLSLLDGRGRGLSGSRITVADGLYIPSCWEGRLVTWFGKAWRSFLMRVTVVLVVLSKTSEEFARNNFGRVVMGKNSSDFSCYVTRWVYALLLSLPIRSGRKSINIWLLFPMKILNAFCVDHVSALCTLPPISTSSPKSHKRVPTQRLSHLCLFIESTKTPLRLKI